jgi:hypothetical protein
MNLSLYLFCFIFVFYGAVMVQTFCVHHFLKNMLCDDMRGCLYGGF